MCSHQILEKSPFFVHSPCHQPFLPLFFLCSTQLMTSLVVGCRLTHETSLFSCILTTMSCKLHLHDWKTCFNLFCLFQNPDLGSDKWLTDSSGKKRKKSLLVLLKKKHFLLHTFALRFPKVWDFNLWGSNFFESTGFQISEILEF